MVTDAVIPVEKCKPHERNYNAHSEAQIADLAESLRQFGQVRSIVVQAQKGGAFLLVAGHGIWLAAKKAGLKELRANVIPASWSKTKVLAYLAADNELSRRGSPDEEQLAAIVRDVCEAEGEAMAALAAGERAALDAILAIEAGEADAEPKVDRAAELQEKWQTALGQLWQIGPHRLLCGDSTRREDVERVMGGDKAQLFVTDPPYGVDYSALRNSQAEVRKTTVEYDDIAADKLNGEELQLFLESVFSNCKEHLDKNAAWYLWHAQLTQGFFAAAAAAADILIHRQIIWAKPSFIFGRGDYHWKHELCFYGWVKGNRPPFYGERNQDTIWQLGGGGSSGGSHKEHPTQKPLGVYDIPIKNHTRPGEILLDPFAGSGTALVACQNLGRVCRAIELSPAYCAVILERMVTAFPALDIHKVD